MSSAAPSSSSSTAPALTFTEWRAKGAAPLARLAAAFPGRPLPSSSIPSDASFKDYHRSMAQVVKSKLRREAGSAPTVVPASPVVPADTTFPEWHESTSQRVSTAVAAHASARRSAAESAQAAREELRVKKALKKALNDYDIPEGVAHAGRTVLLPIELPLQALNKAVDEGTYATVWPALLQEHVPGMLMASLGPTTPAKEYCLRVLAALKTVAPCVSPVQHYDANGMRYEDTDEHKAALPAFLRYRKGRNLVVCCWILSGIQLHRLGLNGHIEALAEVLRSSRSLLSATVHNRKNEPPLHPDDRQLDAELRSLFAVERPVGGVKLDILLRFVADGKLIARDPAVGCALAARSLERSASYGDLEKVDDRGEGKQLAANLRQALRDCGVVTTHSVWLDRMRRITELVSEIYGTDRLHINREGVCTLAWKGAATIEVRRFVVGAFIRNQTVCDIGAKKEHGVHIWGVDDWWIPYTMMVAYCAQHGARDFTCHFPFDDSGETWHALGFTAIARKDHTRRTLEGAENVILEGLNRAGVERIVASNATMQLTLINDLLSNDNVSSFAAAVQQTRAGCTEVLVRTAEGGVREVELTEDQQRAMASEGGPFSQEIFEALQDNGAARRRARGAAGGGGGGGGG